MQALFERSEEAPEVQGLAVFPGEVKRFPQDARVPHMGWNQVGNGPHYYFAHSYYVPECDQTAQTCDYAGTRFTAILKRENIQGVQFHPEKSAAEGLKIVKDFTGPQINADKRR
jgi:imidazole glycerol phosphate synthase glutamine amidotransferase subunit